MIKVVFFDIGNTLIAKKAWIAGAKKLVDDLRLANFPIGVISNTGNLSREQLAGLFPEDFDLGSFAEELVFLSSEVGVEKPNLSIFMMAVQHAKVSPWETLFVGESLTECMAAQKSGMRAARISGNAADYATLRKLLLDSN